MPLVALSSEPLEIRQKLSRKLRTELFSTDSSLCRHTCVRIVLSMRVDPSPRLGGHTVANQPPHYCPPLIHLHSPLPPERCKVSQQVWNRVMN